MWRLQYALGLSDAEFNSIPFERLEQYAYAKGEEVILSRYSLAEATATGINQALSSEDILGSYREDLFALVAKRRNLTEDEILNINEQAAQTLKNAQ